MKYSSFFFNNFKMYKSILACQPWPYKLWSEDHALPMSGVGYHGLPIDAMTYLSSHR